MADSSVFKERVDKILARLKVGFEVLATENDPGKISMQQEDERLTIKVKRIGDYIFSNDV